MDGGLIAGGGRPRAGLQRGAGRGQHRGAAPRAEPGTTGRPCWCSLARCSAIWPGRRWHWSGRDCSSRIGRCRRCWGSPGAASCCGWPGVRFSRRGGAGCRGTRAGRAGATSRRGWCSRWPRRSGWRSGRVSAAGWRRPVAESGPGRWTDLPGWLRDRCGGLVPGGGCRHRLGPSVCGVRAVALDRGALWPGARVLRRCGCIWETVTTVLERPSALLRLPASGDGVEACAPTGDL